MCMKDEARNLLDLNKIRKLCVGVEVEKWRLAMCGSRFRSRGLYNALPDLLPLNRAENMVTKDVENVNCSVVFCFFFNLDFCW